MNCVIVIYNGFFSFRLPFNFNPRKIETSRNDPIILLRHSTFSTEPYNAKYPMDGHLV